MAADPGRPRIFISYRRTDTLASTRSIYERLAERFGDDRVFYDIDTIAPGRDFHEVIAEALDSSDVMLAVIGPNWLERSGLLRRRRLHRPDDFVRLELEGALDRGIFIVPVLVDGAEMPSSQDLPPELESFAVRHAFILGGGRQWRADLQALLTVVAQYRPRTPLKVGMPSGASAIHAGPGAVIRRRGDTFAPGSHRAPAVTPTLWERLGAGPLGWLLGNSQARRRLLFTLLTLLSLAVVTPVIALLVGLAVFDVPSASESAVTQVATFKYADGTALATVRPNNVNRVIVPLAQVPEHVRRAALAAEDPSFYSNPGFDLIAVLTGGDASITQQYVQAVAGQGTSSMWRRYKEIVLAVKISQEQSKDQILENYLNVIYFGRGAYGVQTAAQAFFGKDVKDLTISEGALLAAMIQAPAHSDPATHFETSVTRWASVLDSMRANGWLSLIDRSLQSFPHFLPEPPPVAGIPGDSGGHVYKLAMDELAARGITEQEINTQGLTIDLTIDSKRQEQAVAAVSKVLKGQPANLRSALVSVDPKTGAIIAYYGGSNGVGVDYAQARRQPGSSFKPFVLSAALQDARQDVGLGSTYDGSSPQDFLGVEVSNSEGYSCNPCTVQEAMTRSVNTVFYKMGIDAGPQRVVDAAHQAGIPADELPTPTAGISLGDKEVRPVDMASAFATFAADGVRHDAFVVSKVTAADGRVIYDHGTAPGTQAVPQPVARNVTEAMIQVAPTAGIAPAGRVVAGKTGTVQHPTLNGQNKDAWMVGYTPSVSTAVWVGTDTNEPVTDSSGDAVKGTTLPGSAWKTYMNDVLAGGPIEIFSPFVPLGSPP